VAAERAVTIEPAVDILRPSAGALGLHAIFSPKNVAVVGATEKSPSVGRSILVNLTSGAFRGNVYAVNPKHSRVLGMPCYESVRTVPDQVDLAVVVTPAATVVEVIDSCAQADVAAAIIISAGFREIGPAGFALENQLVAKARAAHMRIVGPNCLGVMSPAIGFNATFANAIATPGSIGFASQSGALCTAILDWSLSESVGFSHFASLGSMADVGWGDVIDYFGDDAATKTIVLYVESVGDARSFVSAAREVAMSKPILVIKGGRTSAAAQAAASHTGALVGSDDVIDAAFKRCGVLRVDTLSQLFNVSEALEKQPRPKGRRAVIVTNAGGAGVLATDALVRGGGQLAALSSESKSSLDRVLPPHWSEGNPVDILGDATPSRYADAIEICERDGNADGLLVLFAPQAVANALDTAQAVKPLAHVDRFPVIGAWMGGGGVAQGAQLLKRADVPVFGYPDTAAGVFNYMWRYDDGIKRLYETPVFDPTSVSADRDAAAKLINEVVSSARTLLTEFESKQLLAAYGIPTVDTRIARSADEAVAAAQEIGFPVVVKLHSQTITHKSQAGGVRLNVANDQAVREAFDGIAAAIATHGSTSDFLGVTVQPMVTLNGYELILGASPDPQFGPVILFGLGGTLVEVFRDRALGLPPLTTTLARRLMEETKIYQALRGSASRAAVDLPALEQVLVRFSELVVGLPRVKEIDINPLLASESSLLALDARVILYDASVADAALPRPAIRPYPMQYSARWSDRCGRDLLIRPIKPEDEPKVIEFHKRLSETSVYLRYARVTRLADRISHQRLARVCFVDYAREIALVAIENAGSNNERIIAIGRLIRERESDDAEFALTVEDDRQASGIGSELLQRLINIAKNEKIRAVVGYILANNASMLRVCKRLGFSVQPGDTMLKAIIKTS
jgi:acetyltransferase